MTNFASGQSKTIHQWGVWSLVEQSFRAPDGELFDRTYVLSPGVVAVVPLIESALGVEVVLVRQYRPALDAVLWEVPAGMLDVPDELIEDAARRELREETGYHGGVWSSLGRIVQAPGMTNSTVHLFMAQGVAPGASLPQGPEERSMSVHRVPLVDAVMMIQEGEIVNAIAVAGILRVARLQ